MTQEEFDEVVSLYGLRYATELLVANNAIYYWRFVDPLECVVEER